MALEKYREIVREMPLDKRSEIFFLKANDVLFKPHINPVGINIVTPLHELNGSKEKFVDVTLDEHDIAYFIIAAPST